MQAVVLGSSFCGGVVLIILICWCRRLKRKLIHQNEDCTALNNTNEITNLAISSSLQPVIVCGNNLNLHQSGNVVSRLLLRIEVSQLS